MADLSLPLQKAVVAALKASTALGAIVGAKIYDRVPDATVAPYVRLSGWQEINDDSDCSGASEVFFDVQCYSNGQGRPQVGQMAAAVKDALNKAEPVLYTGDNAEILHRTTLYFLEDDGRTERAVLNFQALIDGD